MRIVKIVVVSLLALVIVLAVFLRLRFGGGEYYPSVATEPILSEDSLEVVLAFDEPLGNLAVSADNRVFFTVHPESRPERNKVLEVVNGIPTAYPSEDYQNNFTTVLGMMIDQNNQLWTIDHGNHGFSGVRLLAFDLTTNEVIHDYTFPSEVGERLSFFNDLQVDKNGMVYIADVSFFGKNPALVVYNSKTGESRRLLEQHPSVYPQDWLIQNKLKDMSFIGGLVLLKPGIDGIALSATEDYIYYGAMAHNGLYRIATKYLNDFTISNDEMSKHVELVGKKPLSDGLSMDTLNNVYITDVENDGFAILSPDGTLKTLIRSNKIRWADGASYGGDGYLYFTDSAIPDQMLRSKSHMKEAAPYYIFRFNPGFGGIPGR
ncbi:MAG: L-dopachrome tautomerase-related protein [Fulvivirga sp.]|uniref:L-dopachrome tautomerase-related protein n=1 Tax=Fulvivirga sp. TaxID=1931237 RepID=UPI0032ED6808